MRHLTKDEMNNPVRYFTKQRTRLPAGTISEKPLPKI